jgi:hypothetical protein
MNNTLESHKIFPYVAWTLVISFALFTYNLTTAVRNELNSITSGIDRLEMKVDALETAKVVAPKTTTP